MCITIEEYLLLEANAQERHEYRDGEIIPIQGGTPEHSLIIANILGELGNTLKGKPCRVYDANLRIRTPRPSLYTYPDACVICGDTQYDEKDQNRTTVTNPRVIIQVLSKTSESDDRGERFRRFRSLESLEEYVLVSQTRPWIESFLRQSDGSWRFATASGLDAQVELRSLQVKLPLSEIYAGIKFPPEEQLELF